MEGMKRGTTENTFIRGIKQQIIPLLVLVLLIAISSIASPRFLSGANFQNLLLQMAVAMIISCGMFTILLTGGIDLSVGSIVAVSGVMAATWIENMNWILACLLAILVGLLLGIVNGMLVAKVKIAPFIATLGMMNFARGLAYWFTSAKTILWTSFDKDLSVFKAMGGGLIFNCIPIPAMIWMLIFILTVILVKYSKFGRICYAIGGNEEATRLSGIKTGFYKILPYAYTGLLAGLGGIVLTARLGVGAPSNGEGIEMDCITAVVIGGTSLSGGSGNVFGILIGSFILAIINNILNLCNVPSYPQQMLKGGIIVAAVILSSAKGTDFFKKRKS